MIGKNWDIVSVTSETPVVFLLSCHAIRLPLSIGGLMPLLVSTRTYDATVSMGRGSIFSFSTKEKINTRSSTEAELVGVNDAMGLVLWTQLFLEAQGYQIEDNIVYQDNESTMLLAKNGQSSSTKNTRHIDI